MTVSRVLDVFVNLRLLEYSVEGKTGRRNIIVGIRNYILNRAKVI